MKKAGESPPGWIAKLYLWFGWLSFLGAAAVGPCCLIRASYHWLKTGTWIPFGNEWVLSVVPSFRQWLLFPESWFGAHQVAEWSYDHVPLLIVTTLPALWVSGYFAKAKDEIAAAEVESVLASACLPTLPSANLDTPSEIVHRPASENH